MKFDKKIKSKNRSWSFDGDVHNYFDEHITKSVPMYPEIHDLVSIYSDYFINDESYIYDLGCSTGTLLSKLQNRHQEKKSINFVGLDISSEMIEHAKANNKSKQINFYNKNLIDFDFELASIFISTYTMQFINPKYRQQAIDLVYKKLDWGGAFFMFEKVRGSDARFQDMMTSAYTEFKQDQGFDSDEIIDKTKSLKGVLEPFSSKGNLGLLNRAGFEDIEILFRYNCFEGYLAIK
jgi:tRNA (cmo5U34)-methyltransferase